MNITYNPEDLKGKTITKIESLPAEFGRTYSKYLCFTCDDGSRVMIYGGKLYNPEPRIDDMRKVDFFTPEEIGKKMEEIERKKRERREDDLKMKMLELKRLKEELGEV